MTRRDPVEVWPPAAFIEDELVARRWNLRRLLEEVGPEAAVSVNAVMNGKPMSGFAADALAAVFQTSTSLWWNLDGAWWDWLALGLRRAQEAKP